LWYALTVAVPAAALEPPADPGAAVAAPGAADVLAPFKSGRDALRVGAREYHAGDKVGAARALEFAAKDGEALATWKLGRMYSDGDGIAKDSLKAFELFSKLADQYADTPTDSPVSSIVSNAFVVLGGYYLNGIEGTYVGKDPQRARELFHYAATYFSDPEAQFNLARLYINGTGVEKNSQVAARWLRLASRKGHYRSQALLGYLLLNGDGVAQEKARGFMWLTMARRGAESSLDPESDAWITDLYNKAESTLTENERSRALAYIDSSRQ
jgi:TPR repeat protein